MWPHIHVSVFSVADISHKSLILDFVSFSAENDIDIESKIESLKNRSLEKNIIWYWTVDESFDKLALSLSWEKLIKGKKCIVNRRPRLIQQGSSPPLAPPHLFSPI